MKKHMTQPGWRSAGFKVSNNGSSNEGRERVGRRMAGLARGNPQAVMAPIDVVEGQRGHLPGTEPIRDEQEQHRVVPSAEDGPTVDAVQHSPHVMRRNRPR